MKFSTFSFILMWPWSDMYQTSKYDQMNFLSQFQNDRFIASVFRDAVEGSSCHHIPPAKTVGEALERLSEAIDGYGTRPHLDIYKDDLVLLANVLVDVDTLNHLKTSLIASKRTESASGNPIPTLCSDAQWKFLQSRNYKGQRPDKNSVGRLIAEYKRK